MSDMNHAVAIMDQVPSAEADVRGESPLHHVGLAGIAQQAQPQAAGVIFREVGLLGHLTLRLNPDNKALIDTAQAVLGAPLPLSPLTSVQQGERVIRWISPDEWLISLPNAHVFALEAQFREQMNGHYSLVNGSGGLTVFELRGARVVDMLKKSIPVDLHDAEFPVGKVVSTVFAKSGAVVRRMGEKEFELVVRRSFADYIWLWIQSSSQEYGLAVEV
jgi:sarcosine oxidase subunit gamma